ncbi:Meiosis-specific protein ASY1 [Camellia lanceoleosa]|uniref:Meiosis-specific protein ASY1 n=1 Tax=Camellia lanceoleosa TaxID=1840588 RepID=A0ACC0HV62_9ERIC|nr:Meiosis-specific protein ASY1 [Camellia lanceoleosa]
MRTSVPIASAKPYFDVVAAGWERSPRSLLPCPRMVLLSMCGEAFFRNESEGDVRFSEIMDKLVKEGILSEDGTDSYTINKQKKFDYDFNPIKEEMDGQVVPRKKAQQDIGEDHMYMKALYHALPMSYVTVTKLQSKLDGEINQTIVGQTMTLMFVHISPEPDTIEETLSTLKFAECVATVELGATRVNKDGADVKELKEPVLTFSLFSCLPLHYT